MPCVDELDPPALILFVGLAGFRPSALCRGDCAGTSGRWWLLLGSRHCGHLGLDFRLRGCEAICPGRQCLRTP